VTHGDYHPGNVLNTRGDVTAIIDWESAMLGPPAFDVGYCHMDLILAHRQAVGDNFLEAYAHHAGGLPEHLALFPLVAVVRAIPQLADWIPSWQAQGISGLTLEALEQRLARFAAGTSARCLLRSLPSSGVTRHAGSPRRHSSVQLLVAQCGGDVEARRRARRC
jgi:aminoglycoside phosphotransferase (APT) family kinase protein